MTKFKDLIGDLGHFSTKTDTAHQVIREAILSGLLAPGSAVQARKIAEDLDMSLIPVREALRRLEQEGLVLIKPHSGATVRVLPAKDLEENLLIRSSLELLATRLSAPQIGGDAIGELEALLAKMDECVVTDNPERFGLLNREFHLKIYQVNGYSRLNHLIETLWDQVPRARSVFALVPGQMARSQEGHYRLLDALRRHDREQAEEIVGEQKEAALRALLQTHGPIQNDAVETRA